jgi:hypothetical protein
MRTRLCAVVVLTALAAGPVAAQTGVLRGVVRSGSGEPVAQPSVSLPQLGQATLADSLGRFEFRAVPAGSWRLEVRRLGYRPVALRVVVVANDTAAVAVQLVETPIELRELTAEAARPERRRFEEEAVTSTRSLDVRDISQVPSLAETDVLRAVQLLPGVVARNDYSVTLNVRGGDADQNLVLLDGQVVFNPFHLGGLVSTFPDDAIEGLDFLSGGFPARYGGRLSSVLDVAERSGRTDGVHGSAAVSLLATKLHLEGPIPGTRGSWLLAGRRTYADRLVETFTSSSFPYHFRDLLGRVALPSLGGTFSLSGFASGDYFNFELTEANSGQPAETFRFDWGNRVLGATWRRPIGERGLVVQRVGGSSFFADIDVGPGLFRFENRVRRLALSGELSWRGGAHEPAVGYVFERHDIRYTVASGDLDLQLARLDYRPVALEVFAEDQWRPRAWLLVRPGLRLTRVPVAGATLVAPRLAVKAFLDDRTAVSASGGRFHQHVHSLRDEEIPISLFEFWIGSDAVVPVSRADHAVLGLERWFSRGLSLTLEGYWKGMRNLVDGNEREDPGVSGDEFVTARGQAWGFDVFAHRTVGRLTGWIAYTYGRVSRRLDATGERYTPAQDRRHTLNAVASFRGALGADWTVRFGYGSPLPFTGIAGQWVHRFYDPGRNIFVGAFTEPYRTERNALRYPAYSRLDVSARWRFQWLGARWYPTLSLLNAYARTNVFVYFYEYDTAPPLRRGFSQFPFLPTVGLDVEF